MQVLSFCRLSLLFAAVLGFCCMPIDARGADGDGRLLSAVEMMRAAHEGRAMWESFPGFKARVRLASEGKSIEGDVTVDGKGEMSLTLPDGAKADWAERTLRSVVGHRHATDHFESAVTFADEDASHPLGRLIKSTDASEKSLWRVKDDVLTEVHRYSATSHFVISVTEVWRNKEGKHLPRTFSVTTWDYASKTLKSTRQVYNEWTRIGSYDLPTKLLAVNCTADGNRIVEQIELTEIELLPAAASAAAAR
jgi:hypothetical protein